MSTTGNTGISTSSGHGRVSGRNLLTFSIRDGRSYRKGASMPEMIHLSPASVFLSKVKAVFHFNLSATGFRDPANLITSGSLSLYWC